MLVGCQIGILHSNAKNCAMLFLIVPCCVSDLCIVNILVRGRGHTAWFDPYLACDTHTTSTPYVGSFLDGVRYVAIYTD